MNRLVKVETTIKDHRDNLIGKFGTTLTNCFLAHMSRSQGLETCVHRALRTKEDEIRDFIVNYVEEVENGIQTKDNSRQGAEDT